jgi:hypothetical protein
VSWPLESKNGEEDSRKFERDVYVSVHAHPHRDLAQVLVNICVCWESQSIHICVCMHVQRSVYRYT